MTDGERHTENLLSTSTRTAQPLSPEADPFVQGETDRLIKMLQELVWNDNPDPGGRQEEVDFESEVSEEQIFLF